jgi:hypothetical protein
VYFAVSCTIGAHLKRLAHDWRGDWVWFKAADYVRLTIATLTNLDLYAPITSW